MEKILIALRIPSVSECFDLWVPTFLTIKQLMPLILDVVQDCTVYDFVPSALPMLCCKNRGLLLDCEDYSLNDYGIENGDTLFLF